MVDLNGAMIGFITLDRRDADDLGHLSPDGGEAELGYMFLPEAWGHDYTTEACAAALDWFAGALPGEPVILTTQTTNEGSMRVAAKLGSTEVERFEGYGAEQWVGSWSSVTPSGGARARERSDPRDHRRVVCLGAALDLVEHLGGRRTATEQTDRSPA